jgi:dimethylamine/trimethylamine dehydrogenase
MAETYEDVLLTYFEEEVAGEAYFHALAEHVDEPGAKEKLHLLAEVERCAANSVRPLLARHGLEPRDRAVLAEEGRSHIARHRDMTWPAIVADMAERYPAYIDDFERLEAMAPAEDLPALKILTEHEHAAIAFANRELAGDAQSSDALRDYIESCGG